MSEDELSGPRYWKSLDDLAETPAFRDWVEREFPSGASELDGVNRRQFMRVMAASFGLAGLGMSGCRRPEHVILPYNEQPENVIPGVPVYFSSSMPGARENIPLIVETYSGRPTKVEGNPSYTAFGGGTSIQAQASVLDLYDPDRVTRSRRDGASVTPAKVRDTLADLRSKHAEDGGAGLVVLAEPSTSPSREGLVRRFREAFPEAVWAEYSPVPAGNAEAAAQTLYGKPLRPLPRFDKAKRILSLDADFLSGEGGALGKARAFSRTRKVADTSEADQMSRLYSVESTLSSTGSMADHRLRLPTGQMGAFAAKLAARVLKRKGGYGATLKALRTADASLAMDDAWLDACADDLLSHGGASVVVAGEHLPPEVHAVVHALNDALNAPGNTLDYAEVPSAAPGIEAAAGRLDEGGVETLVLLGGNPVFDAPADLGWKTLQGKAGTVVHLTPDYNETAAAADMVIGRSHYLESWGDGRAFDGTLVPVQPMIEPLFPTFDELEVLARLVGADTADAHAIVTATFERLGGKDFAKFLSQGLLADSAYATVTPAPKDGAIAALLDGDALAARQPSANALEARFIPSSHAHDGRLANNGWMMECPDAITKLTWDNAILISPRLATELQEAQGVPIFPDAGPMNKEGGFFEAASGNLQRNKAQFKRGKEEAVVARLDLGGRTVEAPIHVVPGMADYTVALPYGMGRTEVGRVGRGVGFDAYRVRASGGMAFAAGAALTLTEKTYRLANTQEHWSMEGRAIVRESTAAHYKKQPDFANKMGVESHAPANYGKYEDKPLDEKASHQYRGNSAYEHPRFDKAPPNVDVWKGKEDEFPKIQQWGMAIDLNSCTGCSACVVACQSENNIPIVGKEQVLRGREMHWIRLDRYFSAADYEPSDIPEDVQVSFMGMLCQHCENAPCESVCPVNATVHDRQGLNVMAYNRCVGTRYCANNCPYKVRRFNFFDWNKREPGEFYKGPMGPVDEPELEKMQKNPNVTVRMRGVMEKCTFCVQRIESAKIDQKRKASDSDDIHVPDGRIKTACQQVCPTDAITFGDISDPDTEVSRMKRNDRNYSVLGYLNVRPRTTYLARLRNPNPSMPKTYKKPYAYKAYKARYGSGGHADGADHGKASGKDGHGGSHGDGHGGKPAGASAGEAH